MIKDERILVELDETSVKLLRSLTKLGLISQKKRFELIVGDDLQNYFSVSKRLNVPKNSGKLVSVSKLQ